MLTYWAVRRSKSFSARYVCLFYHRNMRLWRQVRTTGESPSAEDVINVAKLFDDDLTLDNLSRPQLVSMSRYMGLHAFGTDNFLRGQIRSRLLNVRRDDQLIDAEGGDSLTTSELQAACQARGIRTFGLSPAKLREELSTWIDLHLRNRVSGVLLILARAFYYDKKPGEQEDSKTAMVRSIESVLCGLPDNLVSSIFNLGCYMIYRSRSSMKQSLKSTRRKPVISRNWRFSNSNKNLLKMSRNKNRKKKMLVVPRKKLLIRRLVPLSPYFQIQRWVSLVTTEARYSQKPP